MPGKREKSSKKLLDIWTYRHSLALSSSEEGKKTLFEPAGQIKTHDTWRKLFLKKRCISSSPQLCGKGVGQSPLPQDCPAKWVAGNWGLRSLHRDWKGSSRPAFIASGVLAGIFSLLLLILQENFRLYVFICACVCVCVCVCVYVCLGVCVCAYIQSL